MKNGAVERERWRVGREERDWIRSAEWDFVAPNPVLEPVYSRETAADGTLVALVAEGNSRPECIGYYRCPVRLKGGAWYRLAVALRFQDLDPKIHTVNGVFGAAFSGGLTSLTVDGDRAYGDERFAGPAADLDAELRLYFRLNATGRVRWEKVELVECDPLPQRLVTVACHQGPVSRDVTLDYWDQWLDRAGNRGANIALLPELFSGLKSDAIETVDGPAATLLSEKARRWKMLTCGTRYERRGDLVYNTARLFGLEGELVGVYDKVVLYESELDDGVSPGSGFGVFTTELGKVGIMTCYEGWFPEIAQELALKGAELVLYPSVGYYTTLGPVRAADNGVFVAASSRNQPAGIWDPSGAEAGEAMPEPSRQAPSGILKSKLWAADHLLVATVDLSRKYSPHWHGGALTSAPALREGRWNAIGSRPGFGNGSFRWPRFFRE